ncbi:choice-of-anchor P family protein [Streptomyces sp. NPDC004232]|uniref:choice-of-anchor P family protein n=1 Tax=Streptomyces sp. NPDC004232 TaxID=3154454 RepID=UPI001DABDF9F|nr:Ig-like domain repeat protein [Streptomyces sp. tea 10]
MGWVIMLCATALQFQAQAATILSSSSAAATTAPIRTHQAAPKPPAGPHGHNTATGDAAPSTPTAQNPRALLQKPGASAALPATTSSEPCSELKQHLDRYAGRGEVACADVTPVPAGSAVVGSAPHSETAKAAADLTACATANYTRFEWCSVADFSVNVYRVNPPSPKPVGTLKGTAVDDVVTVNNSLRFTDNITLHFTEVKDDAANLRLIYRASCTAKSNPSGGASSCSTSPNFPNGAAPSTDSDIQASVAVSNVVPKRPGPGGNGLAGETDTTVSSGLTFQSTNPNNILPADVTWDAQAFVACDNQVSNIKPGCVMPLVWPTLTTMKSLPHIAWNIYKVQRGGTMHYGLAGGTAVNNDFPNPSGNPLTRNEAAEGDNRRVACDGRTSPVPGVLTCDEYPFNATWQGASYADAADWGWAWVPREENDAQGGRTSGFNKTNRILDGDSYWVDVSGATPPPPVLGPVQFTGGITNGGTYASTVAVTASAPHADAFSFHVQQGGVDKLVSPSIPGTPGTNSHAWQFNTHALPNGHYQVYGVATLRGSVVGVSNAINITIANPTAVATTLTLNAPPSGDYHDPVTVSAELTVTGGGPVADKPVSFSLAGNESCTATTNSAGSAACSVTPGESAGTTTLRARFAGDSIRQASSASAPFTVTPEETTVAYTGPGKVANGARVTMSGVLKEDGITPIAGRTVTIALGSGAAQQTCTGTTDTAGTASCAISVMNQLLTDSATLPVTVKFAGDAYYRPSTGEATVRLEYYTGRGFGVSLNVNLPLVSLRLSPKPDTGPVRTATGSSTTTPCAASISTPLVSANALCANVTTRLAPGTSTTTATLQNATIGLPGLPVIGITGLTATSVSSCTATSGSTTLELTIAGRPITVPTAPNSVIGLPGGARLVVNEQRPVADADFGTTVNAVHLVVPGLAGGPDIADIVVGSATSGAHNCT